MHASFYLPIYTKFLTQNSSSSPKGKASRGKNIPGGECVPVCDFSAAGGKDKGWVELKDN
jgi:hypothetical protein